MPEGDTIFRAARALDRALTGERITGFTTAYADLARANDNAPFVGQIISRVESRGKWLLIHLLAEEQHETILATHMLMSGSWHIYKPGEPWQDTRSNARIILETEKYHAIGFRIPIARIYDQRSLARDRKIPQAENDVLSSTFDAKTAAERLQKHDRDELGDALLRQDVLAGVGNVFKSEICFVLGLSPFRKVATLSPQQVAQIVATAQRLLAANVLEDSGDAVITYHGKGRRTTNHADPNQSLWVYGRKGQPCRRCGTPTKRALQGPNARSTYWCPVCQPTV